MEKTQHLKKVQLLYNMLVSGMQHSDSVVLYRKTHSHLLRAGTRFVWFIILHSAPGLVLDIRDVQKIMKKT